MADLSRIPYLVTELRKGDTLRPVRIEAADMINELSNRLAVLEADRMVSAEKIERLETALRACRIHARSIREIVDDLGDP